MILSHLPQSWNHQILCTAQSLAIPTHHSHLDIGWSLNRNHQWFLKPCRALRWLDILLCLPFRIRNHTFSNYLPCVFICLHNRFAICLPCESSWPPSSSCFLLKTPGCTSFKETSIKTR
ncbi:unnamed protein product [Brassica rapa subsp. trilocularis]